MAVSPELEKYIADARNQGMADDEIRQELGRVGWNPVDVMQAFAEAGGTLPPVPAPAPASVPVSPDTPSSAPPSISPSPEPATSGAPMTQPGAFVPSNTGNGRHVARAIVITVSVLLFLAAAGAAAYLYVIPTFLEKPPYRTEAFLTDLSSAISRVDTAVYTMSLSAKTEPRSEGMKSLRDAFPEYAPSENESYYMMTDPSEPLITQLIRDNDMFIGNLPSGMQADLSVQGDIKKSDTGFKPLGHTSVTGSFATPDFSMNLDIEFIARDGVFYGKINRAPSLLFFDFDPIRGKWVKIGDAASDTPSSLGMDDDAAARMLSALAQMPQVADAAGLLSFVSQPQKETSPEGTLYRYDFWINADHLLSFYDQMVPILRAALPPEDVGGFDSNAAEQRKKFADPTFAKFLDYLESQSSLSLWVSAKTKLPVRLSFSTVFVPGAAQATSTVPQQLGVSTSVGLSNVNEPVEVTAPTDFITLEEAYKLITPPSGFF